MNRSLPPVAKTRQSVVNYNTWSNKPAIRQFRCLVVQPGTCANEHLYPITVSSQRASRFLDLHSKYVRSRKNTTNAISSLAENILTRYHQLQQITVISSGGKTEGGGNLQIRTLLRPVCCQINTRTKLKVDHILVPYLQAFRRARRML